MNTYDFIIIGGGIGGLNCAYNLSKYNYKILLLDERKYLGGRLLTNYDKNVNYELGAGRFNKNHKLLINLIKKYKLTTSEIPNDINYKNNKNKLTPNLFTTLIKKIIYKIRNIKSSILKKYTFKEICYKYYDRNYINKIIKYFGYKSEFEILNAYNAVKAFKHNFNGKIKFYILNEGFSELCKLIGNSCIKNNVQFKLSSFVSNVYKTNNLFTITANDINYLSKNIIFGVRKNDLLKFNILNPIRNIINSVKVGQLLRIYAYYPVIEGKTWFHGLHTIVSDSKLKFIIPINYTYGIIMISYTDYKDTKTFIENGKIKSDKLLIKIINKELKKIFNFDIPNPIKLNSYYWINGCHYWKKNYDSEIISKSIINPINNIYICGEAYSLYNQTWIEGALETSDKVSSQILKINKN